jgi:putative hydrolase of HD superfamily
MSESNLHERLLELQQLLVQFAEVERKIYFPDGKKQDRFENDVEHSYNLAMAAWFLAPHFPHLDRDKLIRYALAHDFVEVHAGDVMAIGRTPEQEKTKQENEAKALEKLSSEWPDFSELTETIIDYEHRTDAESKFVYALDKLMPMLLNLLSQGKTWKKYDFSKSLVFEDKDAKIPHSPEVNELWQVYRQIILDSKGHFNNE